MNSRAASLALAITTAFKFKNVDFMLTDGAQCALIFFMAHYKWDHEKNEKLKAERGVGFEHVILHIERGDLLDIIEHPNQSKYPNQRMLIVKIKEYAYLVPFVEREDSLFLKTIIPCRKATRKYLRGYNE